MASASTSNNVLAIDMDEVLAQFIAGIATFYCKEIDTTCTITADQFHTMDFSKVWGISEQRTNEIVLQFYQSEIFQALQPVVGALDALRRLKTCGFELHIVTARQTAIELKTRQWLQEHFPDDGLIADVHFCNHYSTTGRAIPKSEMCQSIGALLLIDDSMTYTTDCASKGIPCILFGRYPWNMNGDDAVPLPDLVMRADGWTHVDVLLRQFLKGKHPSIPPPTKVSLPYGFESRLNAIGTELDDRTQVSKAGDWRDDHALEVKYAFAAKEQAELEKKAIREGKIPLPFGFGIRRDNTVSMEELAYSRSAVASAVAEVNFKSQTQSQSQPQPHIHESNNMDVSMLRVLSEAVVQLDHRMARVEQLLERLIEIQTNRAVSY